MSEFSLIGLNSTLKPIVKTTRNYSFIQRKQKQKHNHLINIKLISANSVQDARTLQCSSRCLQNISTPSILQIRSEYLAKNQLQRNEWIRNYIANNKQSYCGFSSIRWHIY